jgi:hypothetical protein
MKQMPRMFMERQMDWFGKRGISWHVGVIESSTPRDSCEAPIRTDGQPYQTIVHSVESA